MKISLSSFRYTRRTARAYRAAIARQATHPYQWREDGIESLTRDLMRCLEVYAALGQVAVYDRAVSTERPFWRNA